MSLLTRLHAAQTMLRQHNLIATQRALLQIRTDEIERWKRVALEQMRASREIAVAARMMIDTPDLDFRDDLDLLVRDLSDQVAKLEEQII